MAKANITEYDTTPGNNTVINDISIAEGTAPSNINNAIREQMAHIADAVAGTIAWAFSSDAGAAAGPDLVVQRDSASPAADDAIGRVLFKGDDSAGNADNYAAMSAHIVSPTTTAEDGRATLDALTAGTLKAIYGVEDGVSLGPRRINENGAMQLAQRGTSFATLSASQYTLDRWEWIDTGTTAGAVTITQDTDVPTVAEAGAKFMNSLKIVVTTAEDIVGADAALYLSHKMEAQNCTQFGHGAAGAKAGRLSFWFKSTKTGIFTVNVDRNDATEKYSTEFTVGTTNTWEFFEVTVPGDTDGTAVADDIGIGLALQFMMAVGATGKTSTADAWNASGATELATSNQVNLLDNAANNVLITGVQFEMGHVTTPFEHWSIAMERARCDRYYQRYNLIDSSTHVCMVGATGTDDAAGAYHLRAPMRTTATFGVSGVTDFVVRNSSGTEDATDNVTGDKLESAIDGLFTFAVSTNSAGLTDEVVVPFKSDGTANRWFELISEL